MKSNRRGAAKAKPCVIEGVFLEDCPCCESSAVLYRDSDGLFAAHCVDCGVGTEKLLRRKPPFRFGIGDRTRKGWSVSRE